MAKTCKGMMERRFSGLFMTLPGIVFIAIGVLIIVWPAILAWLFAAACILMGTAMLTMALLMRRFGAQFSEIRP
jgi:uncharacterized membrane protein HdeD (DUF308 family)